MNLEPVIQSELSQKEKEQILKAAREKQQITHKGILIRVTADLSTEILQARREWQDILKVMKENKLQLRLLYPARISFKYEGEIKSFTEKQKLREFSTTNQLSNKCYKIFSRQETEKGCINSNSKQKSKWQWDHTYQ